MSSGGTEGQQSGSVCPRNSAVVCVALEHHPIGRRTCDEYTEALMAAAPTVDRVRRMHDAAVAGAVRIASYATRAEPAPPRGITPSPTPGDSFSPLQA